MELIESSYGQKLIAAKPCNSIPEATYLPCGTVAVMSPNRRLSSLAQPRLTPRKPEITQYSTSVDCSRQQVLTLPQPSRVGHFVP